MTLRKSLLYLYALQQWSCLPLSKEGNPYSARWFINQRMGFFNGISRESRRSALRLIASSSCFSCGGKVNIAASAGDHLIPVVKGGKNSLSNYLPMCRSCNASKGKRDLLEWWVTKDRSPKELKPEVLCIYSRLHWQLLSDNDLNNNAPAYIEKFINLSIDNLPSEEHRLVLRAAIEGIGNDVRLEN